MNETQKDHVAEVIKKITAEEFETLKNFFIDLANEAIQKTLLANIDSYMNRLGYETELTQILFTLADEAKIPRDKIFRKALGLFKIALDAEAEGNHLAILNPEDDIIQDIVGINPAQEATTESALK